MHAEGTISYICIHAYMYTPYAYVYMVCMYVSFLK